MRFQLDGFPARPGSLLGWVQDGARGEVGVFDRITFDPKTMGGFAFTGCVSPSP